MIPKCSLYSVTNNQGITKLQTPNLLEWYTCKFFEPKCGRCFNDGSAECRHVWKMDIPDECPNCEKRFVCMTS